MWCGVVCVRQTDRVCVCGGGGGGDGGSNREREREGTPNV